MPDEIIKIMVSSTIYGSENDLDQIKYILEGLAIAIAVYVIPKKKISYQEIALISVIAGAIFAILDYLFYQKTTFPPTGGGDLVNWGSWTTGDKNKNSSSIVNY